MALKKTVFDSPPPFPSPARQRHFLSAFPRLCRSSRAYLATMISICILKVVDPFRSLTCEYPARTALAHNLSREVVALCSVVGRRDNRRLQTKHLFVLNVSYVCPEPVWVNESFLIPEMTPKQKTGRVVRAPGGRAPRPCVCECASGRRVAMQCRNQPAAARKHAQISILSAFPIFVPSLSW